METGRFPNKLKSFRHCAGLSQKNVARKLGFSDTSIISRWEKGRKLPSLPQVFQLCACFDAAPQQLFEELWNHIQREVSL